MSCVEKLAKFLCVKNACIYSPASKISWNENGVEETWEWTPPPAPGVAQGQAVGATKRTGTKGKPSKGKKATKKDSKKGKKASKASKDNKGKASRTTRAKACK